MMDYFADLVAERRERPTEDLISDLTHADVKSKDGSIRKMDNDELLRYISLVAAAGNETVANLMGWAGMTLWRHPDQRQVLIEHRHLIPNAVEELLRYEAPSPIQARVVMQDVEVHGRKVSEGSRMALLTGSAGRDERAYPDPDRFDVRRTFDNHVSFGHGIHFCLGAALARLEARVGLEEMIDRFPIWEVDEARAAMVHTSTVRGWATLPVAAGH
jgi:cytochrome P450